MSRQLLSGWLLLAALVLVSATPGRDALELIRQGNAAFAEGEFDEAVRLYQQAEETTTDPGLAAFNKAVALYRQAQYPEAARYFWRCLGDAGPQIESLLEQHPDRDLPGPLVRSAGRRLPRALYNLGNCALQQSGGTDADLLERAVGLFDHCLRQGRTDDVVQADARHNLELARELLRLNPRPPRRDKSDSEQQNNTPSSEKDNTPQNQGEEGDDQDKNRGGVKPAPDEETNPDDRALPTDERMAGRGNLPTLPDKDELVPLSPEDAAAYLRQAVQRILGERRQHQEQASITSSRDVLDW